jgi:hypothetical protein
VPAADLPTPPLLAWRIPLAAEQQSLRLGMAQVGLATVVCALILLVAAPREALGWGLLLLVPVAIFAAYRKWLRYQRAQSGPANVWIDGRGLHWRDPAGREQQFARSQLLGFRIGREDDTVRPVPALTLYLAGDFESQPIELHEPATAEEVRRVLQTQWNLPERPQQATPAGELDYDLAIDVYSECHDDFQEWHWEGTPAALQELFAALTDAAEHLPETPIGAKPRPRRLLARRRHPSTVRIAKVALPECGEDRLGGPTAFLLDIASRGRETLATLTDAEDGKFDVQLRPQDIWTFHLHVREP